MSVMFLQKMNSAVIVDVDDEQTGSVVGHAMKSYLNIFRAHVTWQRAIAVCKRSVTRSGTGGAAGKSGSVCSKAGVRGVGSKPISSHFLYINLLIAEDIYKLSRMSVSVSSTFPSKSIK